MIDAHSDGEPDRGSLGCVVAGSLGSGNQIMSPLIYVLMCLAGGPGSLDLTADERFWRDEQSCVIVRNNLLKECACVPFAPGSGSDAGATVTVLTHQAPPLAPRDKIGFESLYEIFTAVSGLADAQPLVMDAGDLVRSPAPVVAGYCAWAGIPFRPEALTWEPSELPEWELSKRWHADVAASSGLGGVVSRAGPDVECDPVLGAYLRHHLPYYEALHARRLTV